jgi:hypothetical protein
MRMMILSAALALAGGCAPATGAGAGQTASVRGCQAVATAPWRPLSGVEYTIEAFSSGPDCRHAVATIVIRDAQNSVIWAEAYAAAQVMVLAGANDEPALQAAMSEWIETDNPVFAATGALPAWPAGAAGPAGNSEFPFYLEPEWNDRVGYEELRARNAPMYCYVQGMESLACLALQDGQLYKIGVQSFPG